MGEIIVTINESDEKKYDDDYCYYYHLVSSFIQSYESVMNDEIVIERKTSNQIC